MGDTKIASETSTNNTTTATPTPEETEMNKAQLAQFKAYEPGQTEMFKSGFSLGNKLLTSFGEKDSDMWNRLIGGLNESQTEEMLNSQDKLVQGKLNKEGIWDSGTGASVRYRSAMDLRNQNAQFNVGVMQNALNLALSGQAQIQNPALGQSAQLGTALQGLRTTTTTGSGSGAQRNPFNGLNLGILGTWGGSNYCWVASEIYGGWDKEETCMVRYYIGNIAPSWLRNFYIKYGERIAKFIHNKPIFKFMLKPIFDMFVNKTKVSLIGRMI